jgi:hypothetical protein
MNQKLQQKSSGRSASGNWCPVSKVHSINAKHPPKAVILSEAFYSGVESLPAVAGTCISPFCFLQRNSETPN